MAAHLLEVIPRQAVRTWERPIRHAVSPDVLTGLDCPAPSASGVRTRAVGTLGTHLRVTAGRLLQACTATGVVSSPAGRRLTWSHYLARPAEVELIGRWSPEDVASGFLAQGPEAVFAPGEVCTRWMSRIQASPGLDRRGPLPARRTRVRWAATATPGPPRIDVRLERGDLRTLRVHVPEEALDRVPDLCQDFALHDWLLTALTALVDAAGIGLRDRADVVRRLGPPIDHLVHTWMPGARLDDDLAGYWAGIERSLGLDRQWRALVHRIRDQVSLAGLVPPGDRSPQRW